MVTELIKLDGHVIDSLTLSKVLDLIYQHGVDMDIQQCYIGHTKAEPSHVEILVKAETQEKLDKVLHDVQQHGAEVSYAPATLTEAEKDGVLPDNFYSTTNLETFVRIDAKWVLVDPIEMDCGVKAYQDKGEWKATTVPIHRVKAGDLLVIGYVGVKVTPPARRESSDVFAFMGSDVSSEKPKERIARGVAEIIMRAKSQGQKILIVGGPAIVHTGAAHNLEDLILGGWVDILFAGNALATHDIESALLGTSLGINLEHGSPVQHGHENHLRAINKIRSVGGIRQAVEQGILTKGIMHACVVKGIDFVLAGSIRDDGPLPDVISDSVKAQDIMREKVRGVGVALMIATTLHSVATGNLLPASVTTVCVDSDADTVIKLADRGSHQAYGLVTDCEFFLKELAGNLIRG
ncbi:MAG: TIGR00300 family protein [bacterium]